MTERSEDRTDASDPGYRADMAEFGDAESGGLAAEPSETGEPADLVGAPDRDEVPGGSGDLVGTPTGDLGPASERDAAADRDIDRDIDRDLRGDRTDDPATDPSTADGQR